MDTFREVLDALNRQRASIVAVLAGVAVVAPALHLTPEQQSAWAALIFAVLAIGLAIADAVSQPPVKTIVTLGPGGNAMSVVHQINSNQTPPVVLETTTAAPPPPPT